MASLALGLCAPWPALAQDSAGQAPPPGAAQPPAAATLDEAFEQLARLAREARRARAFHERALETVGQPVLLDDLRHEARRAGSASLAEGDLHVLSARSCGGCGERATHRSCWRCS